MDALIDVGVFLGKLQQAAGGDAEHVDLGFEAVLEHGIQVGDIHGAEAARVEAMFEGIEVAGRGSPGALGGWHRKKHPRRDPARRGC